MQKLQIQGGKPLFGTIHIEGAKNSLLPIMSACLMTHGTTILHTVPRITDLTNMMNILASLGLIINIKNDTVKIDANNITSTEIPTESGNKIRGSIFIMGAMLSRTGTVKLPYPGGCSIGNRPIDIHIDLLKQIGAKITQHKEFIECTLKQKKFNGTKILTLDFPSVGATENIIQATALGIRGNTYKIIGAAKEPEIIDLCDFINACGGNIMGAGTDTLIIHSVEKLHGIEYTPIPDRINTGSYMIAVTACGGEVTLKNSNPEHNINLICKLKSLGAKIKTTQDTIYISCKKIKQRNFNIHTSPYPGFSTDLQSQFVSLTTVASRSTMVTEGLFENRFGYTNELLKMGANITVNGSKAHIKGKKRLYTKSTDNLCPASYNLPADADCLGTVLSAGDLRGGVALVIAALMTDGTTTITNADYIYRGHADIVKDLRGVGANILSIKE